MIDKQDLSRKLAILACCLTGAVLGSQLMAQAAPAFDPIIELGRLGADDMLVINRSGPVSQAGDVNGDGYADVILAVGIGSVRVVFGPTRGDKGWFDVTTLDGETGFSINGYGPHVSAAGDINDDGFDDVMVGSAQGTYVVFGGRDAFPSVLDIATLSGTNGFKIAVETSSVSEAGDVNGDGIDDIIIGSGAADPDGRINAGASYIIFGSRGGFPAVLFPEALDGSNGYTLQGVEAGEESGYQVAAAGDFNSDGLADVLIGAPRATVSGDSEAGKVYVVFGREDVTHGRVDIATLGAQQMLLYQGNGSESFTGRSVSFIGDLNHDGLPDIGVGAPGKGPVGAASRYPGKVLVLFGGFFPTDQQMVTESDLDGSRGFVLHGMRGGIVPVQPGQPSWGDMAGDSIDFAGDVNGDGLDDMIVGASHSMIDPQRTDVGQVHLIYGRTESFPASVNLGDLNGENGFRLEGIDASDYTGFSVSRAGDFNADGVDDVLIGAAGRGESFLLYGRNSGTDAGLVTGDGTPGNDSDANPPPEVGPITTPADDPTRPAAVGINTVTGAIGVWMGLPLFVTLLSRRLRPRLLSVVK